MGRLFQLRRDGSILAFVGGPAFGGGPFLTTWAQLDNNPATIAIAAGAKGLYQLHNDGSIWEFAGGAPPVYNWNQVDNNRATSAIAVGGDLYQLHRDGSIWQYTGTPFTGWRQLDNNPATTAIVATTFASPIIH